MRALLDTHTFLWWITDDASLSENARSFIAQGSNELYLSAASGWEIAIKARLGRLKMAGDPEKLIPEQLAENGIEVLFVNLSHALRVYSLPDHHRDPFDRMLVAQCLMEGVPIITGDPQFEAYGVEILW